MGSTARSPRITRVAWGVLEVDDERTFKDVKLFPGGARAWDWGETGTHHSPGIQPADVEELLQHGATRVVLARGMLRRLRICRETLALLEERDVEVHVLPTKPAVAKYNELREAGPTGGLFHTTC